MHLVDVLVVVPPPTELVQSRLRDHARRDLGEPPDGDHPVDAGRVGHDPTDPHAGEVPVAFVQLQEDADLSPEKIMDYLQNEIGERAAVPKEIAIVDEVPLTPVGKIFKPALRWQAIQKTYQSVLQDLGGLAESVAVEVSEDKIHGSLAAITIQAASGVSQDQIKEKVDELLARYTVKYTVQIT